jgi:hypothetical protein
MYYSLPVLPLLAVLAGHAISEAFGPLGERRHLAHAVVLLGAVPGLYYLGLERYSWNVHGLRMIELARLETPPDARVHDGQNLFNVFRKPLHYYWYSLGEDGVMERFEKVAPRGYDLGELLREHRPRVVATAELERVDPALAAHYAPSPLDERISLLQVPLELAGATPRRAGPDRLRPTPPESVAVPASAPSSGRTVSTHSELP